ncbi:OpgC domain-containing protein [Jannaschia sp. Os4]|uniref:OpgC family protein n=1 Tax=Jannaschia sp. Os4 TaxID=2807617 RepID=UPI0019399873|nr:OpgC domain-containing protein [Jannaschia sp. Os4]MBM2576574.1 OpgC domain-containing protein [Jannaschia sp. Os4]
MAITADFPVAAPAAAAPVATVRDPRLDVFRGLAMFIILLAHTPGNAWTLWIPARWGFSDATEIFVFCSGMASAIAFGRTFDRAGWALGTARVGYRCWQVYWAHIGLFMATLALTIALTESGLGTRNYWGQLNLWPVIVDGENWTNDGIILALMTLRYVPNYFDILPMYLVVLAMMPAFVALARWWFPAAAAASVAVWLLAQDALVTWAGVPGWHLALPAEPWTERTWFFNPFGWQLIFFTGFSFMAGWLPKPPVAAWLIALCVVVVGVNVLYSNVGVRVLDLEFAKDWREANRAWFDKSDFGPLRYLHFLALGYLAWAACGVGGRRLIALAEGAGRVAIRWITKVGQQSLAIFVFSMALARFNGFVLDVIGRNAATWALVNLSGFALLIGVAYLCGWFKSQPWRAKR